MFDVPLHQARMWIKRAAKEAGVEDWQNVGTHAFRRGMAQDIVDSGCPLSVLLRAVGWSSSAFAEYLRADQGQDGAVGQAVIYLSDSDTDV